MQTGAAIGSLALVVLMRSPGPILREAAAHCPPVQPLHLGHSLQLLGPHKSCGFNSGVQLCPPRTACTAAPIISFLLWLRPSVGVLASP